MAAMLHRGHFIRKDHQRMVVWIVVAADWPDFDPHHFHVCLMVAMSNVRINRGEECNQKEARMRPEKPGAGKAPYEDPADAAVRACAAPGTGRDRGCARGLPESREQIAGWRPPPATGRAHQGAGRPQAWDGGSRHAALCRGGRSPSSRVRLKLAQLLVQKQERPARALKVLGQIPAGSLPEPLEALRRQIAKQARQMLEDGVLELEDEV